MNWGEERQDVCQLDMGPLNGGCGDAGMASADIGDQ